MPPIFPQYGGMDTKLKDFYRGLMGALTVKNMAKAGLYRYMIREWYKKNSGWDNAEAEQQQREETTGE